MRKIVLLIFFSITGALLNIGCNVLFTYYIKLPLYLDTVFTVAVTLSCGLIWGTICGALSNIFSSIISFQGWGGLLFALCNIAAAYITWLFTRLFPRELNLTLSAPQIPYNFYGSGKISKWLDKIIVLILLSFALCLAMSVLGGFIAVIILSLPSSHSPEAVISSVFRSTMFSQKFPAILSETLSRIPLNIVDRLISVFAGYGIALGLRSLLKFSSLRP